jgi:hypothetical protein
MVWNGKITRDHWQKFEIYIQLIWQQIPNPARQMLFGNQANA